MRTALAVILAALVLLGSLGYIGYRIEKVTADQVQTHADLKAAQDANHSQALALAAVVADRAADAKNMDALAHQLQAVSADQKSKRQAFAKVEAHATPAEKNLLDSKLPAATLQLFPKSAATAD